MSRVVHLSDLHFGRTAAALHEPLLRAVNALAPDLVAISGDLTQRARHWQFQAAAAFIKAIAAPVLCVPGNHDTPLDNLFVRFFAPWARYRRYIAADLEPTFADDEMLVAGINTVNRFAWQQGRFSRRTLARVRTAFAGETARLCVAVMHHPLEHLPGTDKALMRGAARALPELGRAGADIVLSGHIHAAHAGPFASTPGVLFVQAGTGLSDRLRGVDNSFNLIETDRDEVRVRHILAGEDTRFATTEDRTFRRVEEHWRGVDRAG